MAASDFESAVSLIVANAPLDDQYIHGDATTDVQTRGGPVPSIAKQAAVVPSLVDTKVGEAVAAAMADMNSLRSEAEAARDEAVNSASYAQVDAGLYDSIVLGRGANAATTGPDSFFKVKKGGPDGLTRTTTYQRTSSTAQVLYDIAISGSEFNAIFPDGSTYEPDLAGWLEADVDKNGLLLGGKTLLGADVTYVTERPSRVKSSSDVTATRDIVAGRKVSTPELTIGSAGGFLLLDDDGMSGWRSVELDSNGLIIAGTDIKGHKFEYLQVSFMAPPGGKSQAPSAQYVNDVDLSATYAVYTRGAGKNIDVYLETLATGVSKKLTAGGRNTRPRLSADGSVVNYTRESDGEIMYVPIAGGTPRRVFAVPTPVAYGDSLTNGFETTGVGTSTTVNNYRDKLAALLGGTVINRGTNSLIGKQVATRVGAMVVNVTVAGNQIPASGPVSVTIDDEAKLSIYPNIVLTGTLSGVYGSLGRTTEGGAVTFSRATAGSVVASPAGTAFQVDRTGAGMYPTLSPTDLDEYTALIWFGRNGYTNVADTRAAVEAQVAFIKNKSPHYLVGSITTGAAERNTSGAAKTSWDAITAINAQRAATYGSRYVDLQAALVAAYNPSLAQDVIDHDQGTVPLSLRSDDIHLNAAGYQVVANTWFAKMVAMGWTQFFPL